MHNQYYIYIYIYTYIYIHIYTYIYIHIYIYTNIFNTCEVTWLLRTWAGYLYESISKDDKKKITEKARALDKQMVKVSINKQGNKKVVTEPQLLVCTYIYTYMQYAETSFLD